jgi:hypothetical protein
MKIQWCWRCKTDIPMLDDAEWSQVWAAQQSARPDGRLAALAEYERLTGFRETNYNALFHHRIAAHGPPCPRCGKVLRTPVAYKCFECGHVLHAPGWSSLFTVVRSGRVGGRGTFVEADREGVERRLGVGDRVEVRSGTRLVVRTTVAAIGDAADAAPGDRNRTLWLSSEVPEITPGDTVWLSPPRCGAR